MTELSHQGSLLATRIREIASSRRTPVAVALDGRSGAGKSTLAAEVALATGANVIDGDDFYAGGTELEWDAMTPAQKVDHCIDWRRQRPVLEALTQGRPASWHPYDWGAHDGSRGSHLVVCEPAQVIILDGVYSARPELADLIQLRVLFAAPTELRRNRLIQREGEDHRVEWNARWDEAEQWYFGVVMTPASFDLVIPAI
jgi:uridine kinase